MSRKIYHVSKTHGLSIIEPHICSHNKAYVYASYHLETALLFGGELWTGLQRRWGYAKSEDGNYYPYTKINN